MARYGIWAVVTGVAWVGLIIEAVTDVLSLKQFAALCAVSAVAPVIATLRAHTKRMERGMNAHGNRMERAMDAHANRMECATKSHAAAIARQESTAKELIDIWGRAAASIEDIRRQPSDTGPFPIYHNGSMS